MSAIIINVSIFTLILSSLLTYSSSSNILGLFPHPGYSHFKVFYPILNELAIQGHNITVITYIPSNNHHENYHEILLNQNETTKHIMQFNDFDTTRSFYSMYLEFLALQDEGHRSCHIFYNSGIIEQLLHQSFPFDLIIMEMFNTDCYFGVAELLKIPVIGLSSCALMPWHYERLALPDTPSFIPSEFVGFSERMTLRERIINFIVTKGVATLYRLTEMIDNQIIYKYLKINMDVRSYAKTTSLILVNQHYSLSGARPLSTRVIEIGGIHIENNTDILSQEIENFLENSKNGVIFISWGSMLKAASLDPDKIDAIVKALKKLPQNILWKWETDEIPIKHSKFMFLKWAPQKQILCHPKVQIFWSHGGLLGVSESVYCAKPLIVTPVYGDQFLNGRAVENRQMGVILYHNDLNELNILQKFHQINQKIYSENAVKVSTIYRNRQNTPLETAIWWIEHVLNSQGNNLSYTPAVELNWFVYYSLDVISILIFCILLFIYIIYALFYLLICKKLEKTVKEKHKKKN